MNKREKSIAFLVVFGVLLLVAGCLASILRALIFGSFVDSPFEVVAGLIFGLIAFCFGLVSLAKAAENAQKEKPSKNVVKPIFALFVAVGASAYSIKSIGLDPLEFFHWATWGVLF